MYESDKILEAPEERNILETETFRSSGADGLFFALGAINIWPLCGKPVAHNQRYFFSREQPLDYWCFAQSRWESVCCWERGRPRPH